MAFKILASTEHMPYSEWLEWRKRGIGGSDASVVCGISRYKSPVELWLEKTDQIQSAEAGEAAYEETARDLAAKFEKNFAQYKDMPENIVNAGPKA